MDFNLKFPAQITDKFVGAIMIEGDLALVDYIGIRCILSSDAAQLVSDLARSLPVLSLFVPSKHTHSEPDTILPRTDTRVYIMMAKLAYELSSTELLPSLPVIVRFCGTSKGSADGFELVTSIL